MSEDHLPALLPQTSHQTKKVQVVLVDETIQGVHDPDKAARSTRASTAGVPVTERMEEGEKQDIC